MRAGSIKPGSQNINPVSVELYKHFIFNLKSKLGPVEPVDWMSGITKLFIDSFS